MISIVMSYYNRLALLKYTLQTLCQSKYKNFEVIIVDDFSNKENSLSDIKNKFSDISINVIEMSSLMTNKDYNNPCIPYNVGFRASKGDIILIQNPECCHIGDVISFAANSTQENNYLSFHCFACDRNDLKNLHNGQTIKYERPEPSKARWYNHRIYRPSGYHFCTAISRKNLIKLNGFDERFAFGHSYDDDEFLQRVKNLGLEIQFVDNPHVIHQWHGKSFNNPLNPPIKVNNEELHSKLILEKIVEAPNKEKIL